MDTVEGVDFTNFIVSGIRDVLVPGLGSSVAPLSTKKQWQCLLYVFSKIFPYSYPVKCTQQSSAVGKPDIIDRKSVV